MTLENQTNTEETKIAKVPNSLRLKESVKIQLDNILRKINDKNYGRKVFPSVVIGNLLKLVDETFIKDLQTKSLRYFEKMDLLYQQYGHKYGEISRDEFELKGLKLMSQWAKENPTEFTGNLSY